MFGPEEYAALRVRLAELGEEKFRIFNEKLIPGTTGTYGVRVPQLRALAKELVREDAEGFLACAQDDTHEERMLQGIVIAIMRCPEVERMVHLREFVPKIDNWAVCDVTCGSLKTAAKHREAYWEFLAPYLASEREFEVRFAVVLLLSHFIVSEWIERALGALTSVAHAGYYAKMAVAWALSVCFVKFREETLPIFQSHVLDAFTQDKAIQKCCESFRVSDEDKALLRTMKRGSTGMAAARE